MTVTYYIMSQWCFLGVSMLTLDEYALIPGGEEDKLRELSALMIQAIPTSQGIHNITDNIL